MSKKVVLLTQHVWNAKRRAGFHWIADALWQQGWEIYFVTDWLSLFDKLRGDYRFNYLPSGGVKKLVLEKERLFSYVCYHPWRPLSGLGDFLNALTYPFFNRYSQIPLPEIEAVVKNVDLFIFESSIGLMFFERFRTLNPTARTVYRVSDDIHLFKIHPTVADAEFTAAGNFDLISVPTQYIYDKFSHLTNVRLQKHGIPTHLYAEAYVNPYEPQTTNIVFVGNLFLDYDFINRASRLYPTIQFHIIGPFANLPQADNIHAYGELPYQATIPYVKYADIGLNTCTKPSLSDSNKMMQYQYCQLPVIMADIDRSDKPFVFYYRYGNDDSIYSAIEMALEFDRSCIPISGVQSWLSLAKQLAGEPPND